MWHKIAPGLAERFTAVLPDLRGYGDSGKPAPDAERLNYSQRALGFRGFQALDALGCALPRGHFLPEEAPRETLAATQDFLVS